MIKDLVLQLGIVDATVSLVWQIKLTHITRRRRLGAQVPRALGAGRRLAGRDGRPGARRRRQPELDPVNQGELVMVVDL